MEKVARVAFGKSGISEIYEERERERENKKEGVK